jgi:hypothetical protein
MSALATLDFDKGKCEISALLIFYGKYAQKELASKITKEINDFWNEPNAKIEIQGIPFHIVFNVDYKCLDNLSILEIASKNQSFENNFIRIEDQNIVGRSMMGMGLGENSGHWLITDNLGESTTAAHEFGHALGLPHPKQLDYRNTGMPPIMAPRGTIVDAQYQWNPLAEPGQYGGTMRPIWRRVRNEEVLAVFENYSFEENSQITIGKITNYLFDEKGNLVKILN